MQTTESTFYIDVRDGTVEQHLGGGEVRTFPPSSGKSVSPLLLSALAARVGHRACFASTRDASNVYRRLASANARPPLAASRLLAGLMTRV